MNTKISQKAKDTICNVVDARIAKFKKEMGVDIRSVNSKHYEKMRLNMIHDIDACVKDLNNQFNVKECPWVMSDIEITFSAAYKSDTPDPDGDWYSWYSDVFVKGVKTYTLKSESNGQDGCFWKVVPGEGKEYEELKNICGDNLTEAEIEMVQWYLDR